MIYLCIFGFVSVYLFYFLGSDRFRIKTIVCQTSNQKPCHESVQAELNKHRHAYIFWTHFNEPTAKILKSYPAYESLMIKKKYPDAITVFAQENAVMLQIQCEQSIKDINTRGFVSDSAQVRPELAQITATPEVCDVLPENELLDKEVFESLKSLLDHISLTPAILSPPIWQDRHTYVLQLENNRKAMINPDNLDQQFQKIEVILESHVNQEVWTEIDLRFDKPVLR